MYIRDKYHIPVDGRILLYVGNISENKNQRQMVEAYELLPEGLQNKTWVLFCGAGRLQLTVYNPQFTHEGHLVWCGSVAKEEMPDYYREADGVVLLSHAEGFGLSLVEGMHFGVPCAMFADMDAFEDIYDESAVVAIHERTNEAVTKGLVTLLTRDWNKEIIKESSKRFDSVTMAINYIKVYTNEERDYKKHC